MTDVGASERHEDAPSPDDARKPDTPAQITKPSWGYVLRKTGREFTLDQCIDSAGSLTYFGILSLFPALLAAFSLLGVVGAQKQATQAVLHLVSQVAPGSTASVVRGPVEQFAHSPAAGFALISGIVVAIWTASGYIGAFSRAMNRVYDLDEGRPYWKRKPGQLLITLIIIVLVIVVVLLLSITGSVTTALGRDLHVGATATVLWSILKWPVLAAAAILIVAILYFATPNAKQPKFRWLSLGSTIALALIIVASVGFGFYVANFSHYNKSYGSLAGIIIFFIWVWITNLALLFGAEFDAEVERGRELQAGIKAEDNLQVRPRDATASKKRQDQQDKDIAEGRRLRETAGRHD